MPFGGLLTAGIGVGGSLIGGLLGSSASAKAAAIQQKNAQQVAGMATSAANDAKTGVNEAVGNANLTLAQTGQMGNALYGNQSSNLNPYLQAGTQGVSTLAQLMAPGGDLTKQFSFDPSQIASTPEYQFALQQGDQAVQQSAAARGLLGSGGTLKALTSFGQGLASQQYQQAYQNALNTFQTNRNNTLQGLGLLTNVGQTATGQYNQATQNYAGQNLTLGQLMSGNLVGGAEYAGDAGLKGAQIAGSALTGGANAAAAGTIGSANAWSNALSGATNAISGGLTLSQLGQYSPGATYGGGTPYTGAANAPQINLGPNSPIYGQMPSSAWPTSVSSAITPR